MGLARERWTDDALADLARFVLRRHGEKAEFFARGRARMFERAGEAVDACRWRAVADLIADIAGRSVIALPRQPRSPEPRSLELEAAELGARPGRLAVQAPTELPSIRAMACRKCGSAMVLTRRTPHPTLGMPSERRSFECTTCGFATVVTETPGP